MLIERDLTPSETPFQERLLEKSGIITTKAHNHHYVAANDSG